MWIEDMFIFIKDWWFLITFTTGIVWYVTKTLNKTLIEIKDQLQGFNWRMELSEKDRVELRTLLNKESEVNDTQDRLLDRHHERIRSLELFRNRIER